jgi:hypothetical protein
LTTMVIENFVLFMHVVNTTPVVCHIAYPATPYTPRHLVTTLVVASPDYDLSLNRTMPSIFELVGEEVVLFGVARW